MIHKPRTLLWRLGLALMAAQVVIVVLLSIYAVVNFHRFQKHQAVAELERSVPLLAQRYAALLMPQFNSSDLMRTVEEDRSRTALRITLIAPDGSVIADSHISPDELDNHRLRPEVDSALAGAPRADVRGSVITGEQTAYLASVIEHEGEAVLIVRAAIPIKAIGGSSELGAWGAFRLVALAGAFSLGLTFAMIYLVSRRTSRSIQYLADGASRFAAGDLAHRIRRPDSRELASLASALNHMAGRLKDQIELLQSQRAEQQAIHQSMTNGLIALDPEQRIISVNRAAERLLNIDGAESRGRLLQEVIREPELHRFVTESLANAQADSAGSTAPQSVIELQLKRPGDASGPRVHAVSQPLRTAGDQPAGLLVLMTDVTELRRLETIRSDFAANVSHELRTPITNIRGYVETLLDIGVKDADQARRFLEIISRNTHRLASIIEDLLALARLEQPDTRSTLEKQTVSVQRVVDAALTQLESETSSRKTKIVTTIPASLQAVANVQLLEQALGNLISNAVKYSPPETTVMVTAEPTPSGGVTIAVADAGPGIPEEHLSRIFERFYRVDRARSREMGGTGLGLAIVKHIALVHRGSVTVESRVGRGSTFRLTLPPS